MENKTNRHLKGRERLLQPRKRPNPKNSGEKRYLTIEERIELRNGLKGCESDQASKGMRKSLRKKFDISNEAITKIMSEKYQTTHNDEIRVGAGMNPDMQRPFVHNENHLILGKEMIQWIEDQKQDTLLKQLPISRSQIITRAIRFDSDLNLGVFPLPADNSTSFTGEYNETFVLTERLSDISDESSWNGDLVDSELEDEFSDNSSTGEEDYISDEEESLIEEIDIDIDEVDDGNLDAQHVTWFMNFIYRYRLARKVAHGEAASCPSGPALEQDIETIRTILREYAEEDIYNMDEKSLFYTQLPKVRYVFLDDPDENNSKGSKLMTSKDRATI